MKCLAVFLLILCSCSTLPQTGRDKAVLPADHYELAEFVFRQYMSADSTVVFHLSYGENNTALPEEFVARFKGQTPLVSGKPDGIEILGKSILVDRMTRKEAAGLEIQEIKVTGDTAEVGVIYSASHTSNSTRFHLVRERGKWRVKERKAGWIMCG